MREQSLQASQRGGCAHGPKAHDRTIITETPDGVRGTGRRLIVRKIPASGGGGPEENTSGSTAYPTAKARRDNSMPAKRGATEDVYGVASRDPRDKVKATLLEPQPAAVTHMTPRL